MFERLRNSLAAVVFGETVHERALNRLLIDEYRSLAALPSIAPLPAPVRAFTPEELGSLWNSRACAASWEQAERSLAPFRLPDMTGGVNPGDRRAVFYLTSYLQPRRILEIGTHLGCSTVSFATALMQTNAATGIPFELETVDCRDVNDPATSPWKAAGALHSPQGMIRDLGCADHVRFLVHDSLAFLRAARGKTSYDFIFLDGDHTAKTVYQEIPAALALLNPGGVILLHDVFPDLKPLWSNGSVLPGPYLAVQRLRNEHWPIDVRPLGKLPWPTKLGSNVTSLAVVAQGHA